METERDALVPKARALPTPTVVHWGHIQKYLNPILAIAIPAVCLSVAVSNANDKNSQDRTTGRLLVVVSLREFPDPSRRWLVLFPHHRVVPGAPHLCH